MKNVRFLVLGGLLVAGVATAVASLRATFDGEAVLPTLAGTPYDVEVTPARFTGQAVVVQGSQDQTPDRGRRMMFLDGRGSHLGVMVQDSPEGVRVDDVDQDSPAEKAGLREGDIVTEFDGERVRSARQFTRLVQETPDGRSVRIGVLRGGQKQTVEATPQANTFSWNFEFDGDRIQREFERGMRGLDNLREFRVEPREFNFGFGDGFVTRLTPRGRLGVTLETLTPQLQEYFGAKEGGALVSSVTTGSAAEKAGVKAGDVITSINGDRVQDAGDVIDELAQTSGTDVTIGIVRDKKAMTLKATVEPQSAPRRREVAPRQPAVYVRPA